MTILPAIIPKTLGDLKEKVAQVSNHVRFVHIDQCDGKYVPSVSWPYAHDWNDFAQFEAEDEGLPDWKKVDYQIDLMVARPQEAMERWIRAGASSFVVHAEGLEDDFDEMMDMAHTAQAELGIALLPQTNAHDYEHLIQKADFVQCMGIAKIGYQGVPFDERIFDQMETVRKIDEGVRITVDGHVNLENIDALETGGASQFVIGSALFESENIPQFIHEAESILMP
jgi:ribulose-phosphate 3-epimerase